MIIIHLDGGLVQGCYSDDGDTCEYLVVDTDIDGLAEERMASLADGTDCYLTGGVVQPYTDWPPAVAAAVYYEQLAAEVDEPFDDFGEGVHADE